MKGKDRPECVRATFQASDGLTLAYSIDDFTDPWRNPEPLILLHSAMSSSRRLYTWVPKLSRRYLTARLDLRGHGKSALPPADEPLTIDRLVKDVLELMDVLGWRRAHFAGCSAGGYLCQRIAIDHPERVATMALYGSTPGLKRSQAAGWVEPIHQKGLRTFLADTISDRFPIGECDPGLVKWFLDQAGSNDQGYIIKFVTLMAQQDWADEMVKIQCPTLVVIPGLGKIGEDTAYEPMKRDIKDVRVLTYEGAQHNIPDFLAERCVQDLLKFLELVGSRSKMAS